MTIIYLLYYSMKLLSVINTHIDLSLIALTRKQIPKDSKLSISGCLGNLFMRFEK